MPEPTPTRAHDDTPDPGLGQTLEALNNSQLHANVKTIGEAASFAMGLAFQNSVANQQSLNGILTAATAQAVNKMHSLDVNEAVSVVKTLTGGGVDLAAMIALAQQMMKGAQTTPPPTA